MQALAHVATLARLAAVAAVLALVGLLGLQPGVPGGADVRALGPLPACRYDDILTSPRGYAAWSRTLVDTILRVPRTYVPPDLVRVASLGVPGTGKVRQVMAADLQALSQAAAAAGNPIGVHSAYRSYETQEAVFAKWVQIHGRERALKLSARPGHSEHQLGLGVDFRSDPPVATLEGSWGTTPAGMWMAAHAWEYGFIMSYPKGKLKTTCYAYEPWHFRYVGRERAAQIRASGLTVREYLWANFTTTVVPPPTPKPTVKPAATTAPTPLPSSTPATTPSTAPSTAPTATPAPTRTPAPTPAAPTATLAPPTSLAPSLAPSTAPPGAPAGPIDDGNVLFVVAPVAVVGGVGMLALIALGLARMVRRGRSGVGL